MTAYYNDNDLGACYWLKELMKTGLIAPGDVDSRSITEVTADDIKGYTQVHFFAGIGGWSYALRLADWSDDTPVWTGSCPCQPFSIAGKRRAESDERHLWPEFYRLIKECQPSTVFGEQVASPDGREWLLGVFADLETLGYAAAGADLCAAGVGAPHIRQRLYWVGISDSAGYRDSTISTGSTCGLAKSGEFGRGRRGEGYDESKLRQSEIQIEISSCASRLGNSTCQRCEGDCRGECQRQRIPGASGAWDDFDIIPCRDGKARRVESGTFPLVDGFPERVGLLRGYGNAIVPQLAAEFIQAAKEYSTEDYSGE